MKPGFFEDAGWDREGWDDASWDEDGVPIDDFGVKKSVILRLPLSVFFRGLLIVGDDDGEGDVGRVRA